MTKPAKALLVFSIATIAFSFTDTGSHAYYGILRPVGAVAFIVFFIINMLANLMKQFDTDQPGEHVQNASRPRVSAPLR